MEPLEHRRQFVRRDALACIAHAHATLAVDHSRGDVNSATGRGMTQGVVEEVREDLLKADAVSQDPARDLPCIERQRHFLRLILRKRCCHGRFGNPGSVDAREDKAECMLFSRGYLAQIGRKPPQSIDLAPHRRP